jgi:hypothetical protein
VSNRRPSRHLVSFIWLPALLLISCGGTDVVGGDPNAPTHDVTIRLENNDQVLLGDAVHLFAPGETFPSGRVEPAFFRNVVIKLRRQEKASFQAGRSGSILKTIQCTCATACPQSTPGTVGSPKVTWNGSALACVGW